MRTYNSHPKVLRADEATTSLGDATAHSKNLVYFTSCHLVISTTNDKDFCRFGTPPLGHLRRNRGAGGQFLTT